jgi:hypothetical protein
MIREQQQNGLNVQERNAAEDREFFYVALGMVEQASTPRSAQQSQTEEMSAAAAAAAAAAEITAGTIGGSFSSVATAATEADPLLNSSEMLPVTLVVKEI